MESTGDGRERTSRTIFSRCHHGRIQHHHDIRYVPCREKWIPKDVPFCGHKTLTTRNERAFVCIRIVGRRIEQQYFHPRHSDKRMGDILHTQRARSNFYKTRRLAWIQATSSAPLTIAKPSATKPGHWKKWRRTRCCSYRWRTYRCCGYCSSVGRGCTEAPST